MPFVLPFWPWGREDLTLGRTGPFFFFPAFRLRPRQRETHMYVLGVTGQGKSKLLENCLYQDITAGRGVALVDPHSDLAQDVLAFLSEKGYFQDARHRNRVIYFDPARQDALLPFNVLRLQDEPYTIAVNLVEAFRRTWPESLREAPRFSNVLIAAILALIANRLTLVELPRLLTDRDFREALLENVSDPEVVSVFHDRVDKWGRERAIFLESILNKISALTLNPTLRKILGQQENRLDFRRIMDEGMVLIVDLGRCDGETRRLLGSLIVTGIEQAALSRKDEPQRSRRPFFFYVDEFQDFAANEGSATTFLQILSESRKFGLHLTLAHQTLGQLSHALIAALANIGTKVVFAVDREDAEIMARKIFQISGEEVKHNVEDERQQEKSHPVFYSLSEEWEKAIQQIQNLKPRTAFVKAPERKVAWIQTIPIPKHVLSESQLENVRRALLEKEPQEVTQVEIPAKKGGFDDGFNGQEAVFFEPDYPPRSGRIKLTPE